MKQQKSTQVYFLCIGTLRATKSICKRTL